MKRNMYALLVTMFGIPIFILTLFSDHTEYGNFPLIIAFTLIIILTFVTSYLLIVKKSYNLLAGMTEEKAAEVKNNPEEEMKEIKTAKIIGYIFLVSGIIMIFYLLYRNYKGYL